MKNVCSICGNKTHAKNLCQKHYRRALAESRGIRVSNVRDLSLADIIKAYSTFNPISTCWEWNKSCYSTGYGQLQTTKTTETLAHRISYLSFVGSIPANLFVCHKCDNPKCVNPEHLFLGTAYDNTKDRDTKNRQAKGSIFKRSSLTFEDVIFIRNSSLSLKELANMYDVSKNLISQIRLRKKWKHVP